MLSQRSAVESVDSALSARLDTVEAELLRISETRLINTTAMAQHVIKAGGKRFRPMLVFLASAFGPGPIEEERLIAAAMVVELTHVASLYHDDVMDEASLRRGQPSANARWGNSAAILIGDYLFSRASSLVSTLGVDFVEIQAETFADLVQGQLAETIGPRTGQDQLDHYLEVLSGKTAALIATSAIFGARVAGASAEIQEVMRKFGHEIGMTFQLRDDILDITSDATGKTPGTDLREGIETLPVILLRQSADPADQALVRQIDAGIADDQQLAAIVSQLRDSAVMVAAEDFVRRYETQARAWLDQLPDNAAKQNLLALAEQVVTRLN